MIIAGNSKKGLYAVFLLAFLFWIFSFCTFLTGENVLVSDAIAYYEHFQYFNDNISRGIYPLWEPTRSYGVPVEFFLRRIGSYNPFICIIVILEKIGLSFTHAYLSFLTVYYFIGMIGFYLVAERLFKDQRIAFVAFLLLMFSSLGTRMFDSYILLTIIPMIWFFYFLVSFVQNLSKHACLGMTFALMLLMTTYIPFYFLTIFILFIMSFMVFYPLRLKLMVQSIAKFIKNNKLLACFCILSLLASSIPGYLLFKETKTGEVIFAKRHVAAPEEAASQMEVGIETIAKWGILEDIVYSLHFLDFDRFKFAVLYIPIFAYILFIMGAFLQFNKRLLFFAVWGFLILICCSTQSPVHHYLYNHIFYFKYFRNLHFFLWMALLPIFILFVTEQLRILLATISSSSKGRLVNDVLLLLVHLGFAVFLYVKDMTAIQSYVVIIFSFFFFMSYNHGKFSNKNTMCLLLLLCVITIQPLSVYRYLAKNSPKTGPDHSYRYNGDKPYFNIGLPNKGTKEQIILNEQRASEDKTFSIVGQQRSDLYMGLNWYNVLLQNFNHRVIYDYLSSAKFIAYDRVEYMDDLEMDFKKIGKVFWRYSNVAYTASKEAERQNRELSDSENRDNYAQIITHDMGWLEILNYNVNRIQLKTNFPSQKYLVFNDNYHTGWHASIDGEKTDIYRTNIAFKGLWVPSGEHTVILRFEALWKYWLHYGLMAVFGMMLIALLRSWRHHFHIKI